MLYAFVITLSSNDNENMKCWWVAGVKSWDELSSLLAYSLLWELAHKLTTAGCRGEQSSRFMRRSLTHPQLYSLSKCNLYTAIRLQQIAFSSRGQAKPPCICVPSFVTSAGTKEKPLRLVTERYYVIGKWIALCMPGQSHWGSSALRTWPL